MSNLSKLAVMVAVMGIAGVAQAKGAASIDDLFANANSKASKSSSKAAPKAAAKVSPKKAAQPRVAAAAAAPNRAPKAAVAAPAATPSAPAAPNAGPAPVANNGNTMVLADYAPDRHALAGP